MEKLMGQDKDQSLSLAKLTRLGTKLNILYCKLKIDQNGENQTQKHLPPTLCLPPRVSFSTSLTTLSSPRNTGDGKRGGLWSAHNSSSLLLSFLLTHFHTPAWTLHWVQGNPHSFIKLPSTFKFELAIFELALNTDS